MIKLHDGEFNFMNIVWDNEPLSSKQLTIICEDKLGWKRTTTYTVLKKLITKGFLVNNNAVVSSIIKRKEVKQYESNEIINSRFNGSLSGFVTSFVDGKELSKSEIDELQSLIDSYKEE